MAESEQNKSEQATPFKLKRGREKGMVAKSADLGFFSALAAFGAFALIAGPRLIQIATETMRDDFSAIPVLGANATSVLDLFPRLMPVVHAVALLGVTIIVIVALFEIAQVGGVIFALTPLKPDFNRLNPAKGFKRVFSMRMLKETVKNVLKLAAYSVTAYLIIRGEFSTHARTITDAASLTHLLRADGLRLLFAFTLVALFFAGVDQALARTEFAKQMRMSKSEVTREHKEREGEPRLKQKRRQLHAQFSKQTRALGNLAGSDMLVVNPEHYAVALRYDASRMAAPVVTAKGRNHFALYLKRRAGVLSIPIFEHPVLARALYKHADTDQSIRAEEYRPVADLYLKLARSKSKDAVHG